MNDIYVILIDGRPYLKDSAIRTYKTRERAEKEARNLLEFYRKYRDNQPVSRYEVGTFALANLSEVSA